MLKRADVVVIGSGGLGAATAFYLAKRNAGTVVLVDRHEIGSQTSPRAAGMVSCMRKGEVIMRLIKVAATALQHFAERPASHSTGYIPAASRSRVGQRTPR
jgi:glycine/D-amino acid oxidase-like deaminating enzyme